MGPASSELYARASLDPLDKARPMTDRDAVKEVVILENNATRPSLAIPPDQHCLARPSTGFCPLDHPHADEFVPGMARIGVSDGAHDHLALARVNPLWLPSPVGAAHHPGLPNIVHHSNLRARRPRIEIADGGPSHTGLGFHKHLGSP